MLDRIAQLVPGWTDHNPADLGVTLVELLAYVGDQLCYSPGRDRDRGLSLHGAARVSLRRHALLVDYRLHDGCNARSWVQLQAGADDVALPQAGTRFYSRLTGVAPRIAPGTPDDAGGAAPRPDGLRAAPRRHALPGAQRDLLLHLGRPAVLPAARAPHRRR